MNLRSGRGFWLVLASCAILGLGCVERRFVITTDPPGAIVYDWKGQPLSASPADTQFVYYGKYRFTLLKDGYETLVVEEQVRAPWYEWFLLDFVSENLVPFTIRDVRHFHYQMKPLQTVPPEVLLQAAQGMRQKGQSIGPPVPPPPPQPTMPMAP